MSTGASPDPHLPPPDAEAERQRALIENALLTQIQGGNQAAFAQLYDRFSRPLLAVARRILSDASEAEDIVHDVFVTLWEKSRDFDPTRGSAFGWLVTLTRNRAIDRVRTRRRRQELLDESAPSDLPVPDLVHAEASDSNTELWLKEKASYVRQAVQALAGEQRVALELAFFSGLTQQEIAARLDQPLGTVKARIRRGLLKLRDTLTPQV